MPGELAGRNTPQTDGTRSNRQLGDEGDVANVGDAAVVEALQTPSR